MLSFRIELFSVEVRQKYPSSVEFFDGIEKSLVELEQYSPWELPEENCLMTSGSPFFKTFIIVSCCSLRSIDIINGLISLVNTNNTFCTVFLIRAQIETCGMLAVLHEQLRLLKQRGDYQIFDTKLEKLILGGKKTGDIAPYNVMELIRTIDSEMSFLEVKENTKLFENEIYALLCEEVHPNWQGLWGRYCRKLDNGSFEFKEQEPLKESELMLRINFMYKTIRSYLFFADRCTAIVKTIPNYLVRN